MSFLVFGLALLLEAGGAVGLVEKVASAFEAAGIQDSPWTGSCYSFQCYFTKVKIA